MAILRPKCSQLEKSGAAFVIDVRANTLPTVRGFSDFENIAFQKCGSCAYFAIKSPKSVAGWNFLVIVLGNPCLAAGYTSPVTFFLGILQLHCCSLGCSFQDLECVFPAWIIWTMLLSGLWSRVGLDFSVGLFRCHLYFFMEMDMVDGERSLNWHSFF